MKFYLLFVMVFFFATNCNKKTDCKIGKIEQIQSIRLQDNSEVSYLHEVLLEGLDQRCLDSLLILEVAKQYIQEQGEVPVAGIQFFNSKQNFDAGETLSKPKAYFDNSLVLIWFDFKTGLPKEFVFYKDGDETYRGTKWKKD